jgi:hypothetical protein
MTAPPQSQRLALLVDVTGFCRLFAGSEKDSVKSGLENIRSTTAGSTG